MPPILNNIYREKLLNAILHFARAVKHPSRMKIFKLLYFLDFLHFRKTGRPVTNLAYFAWEQGPVPAALWHELKYGDVPEDFKDFLAIQPYTTRDDKQGFNFKAKKKPDLSVFSPREQELLEKLAFIFKDATPSDMSEASHLHNAPWDKTKKEKGEGALIDYILALEKDDPITVEEAEDILKEREELFRNFQLQTRQ